MDVTFRDIADVDFYIAEGRSLDAVLWVSLTFYHPGSQATRETSKAENKRKANAYERCPKSS